MVICDGTTFFNFMVMHIRKPKYEDIQGVMKSKFQKNKIEWSFAEGKKRINSLKIKLENC